MNIDESYFYRLPNFIYFIYISQIFLKSQFIDEFQLLKNKTIINKEQDCNINTEETTTLKNKIKPLELKNKLLKDEVTNITTQFKIRSEL